MSDCEQRITEYLSGGGLFNPECADHNAVRDLLIDCRNELAAERKRWDTFLPIIRAVSAGVQPEDYGRPDVAIRRWQMMIDEAMENG
jgi:hypothetical protein